MVENCHLPAIPSYNQHFTGSSKCCYSNFFSNVTWKRKWIEEKRYKIMTFTKTAILCFMTERKLDLKQKHEIDLVLGKVQNSTSLFLDFYTVNLITKHWLVLLLEDTVSHQYLMVTRKEKR